MSIERKSSGVALGRPRLGGAIAVILVALAVPLTAAVGGGASPAPGADNPWVNRRVVGLAHAGGEDENPHSTLYGFGQATNDGATMLDMDLQITSDKWAVHIEGKRRASAGEDLIFLSIGEPDAPTPTSIMDVVNTQMRAGRYKYAASRGECGLLDGLSAQYSKSTGRPISTSITQTL